MKDHHPDLINYPHSDVSYLKNFEKIISENYDSATLPSESFPRAEWKKLTDQGILLSVIPKEYGGRDSHQEICELIKIISRYNLPLAMYTMIITVTFVRNVVKYGSTQLKREVLFKFCKEALVGGFALTEPHCGSDLAKMETTFEKVRGGYKIVGEKHWQAFSLTADWWLVIAKNKSNNKEFAHFVINSQEGWTNVEKYNSLGLKAIDYGRNEINAFVPTYRRLNTPFPGLLNVLEMLCASRLSMCAMASGFISRIYDESIERTENRKINNGTLYDIGYVKYKLQSIAANKTVTQALLYYTKYRVDFRITLLDSFFEAQCIKVLSTDKMLESALNYQQLCGGEGYRHNAPYNNAASFFLDARVYTIFDGTNDMLSQQIAEFCYNGSINGDVVSFLSRFSKTKLGVQQINFDISVLNNNNTHPEKVMNGQIISRIFGLQCLCDASDIKDDKHFHKQNHQNAIIYLIIDIQKTIAEAIALNSIVL